MRQGDLMGCGVRDMWPVWPSPRALLPSCAAAIPQGHLDLLSTARALLTCQLAAQKQPWRHGRRWAAGPGAGIYASALRAGLRRTHLVAGSRAGIRTLLRFRVRMRWPGIGASARGPVRPCTLARSAETSMCGSTWQCSAPQSRRRGRVGRCCQARNCGLPSQCLIFAAPGLFLRP